ncbi:MAG: type 2 isopentenyl-diphosphate Delta-isomerase [Candidatus Micrarchaeota archaeon]
MSSQTSRRKYSHVDICLRKKVEARSKSPGFEDVDFVHQAVQEIDFNKITIACKLFGKKLSAPIIIESITGGYEGASKINYALAESAEKEGVALALGSQRAMLENSKLASTYSVRKHAPTIPIFGNIGLAQINAYTFKEIESAISKIEADALVVHLNGLQEICQKEGDRDFSGLLKQLENACSKLGCPIIAKETGAGISMETAAKLEKAGVAMIDVAGAGGTSWCAVELYRGSGEAVLWDWGIPTTQSVIECAKKTKVPIIASGGVRSGLDVAKSLAIGASFSGAALPFLKKMNSGGIRGLRSELAKWKHELKMTLFLCGAKDLKTLSKIPVVITGKTAETLRARGIDPKEFGVR